MALALFDLDNTLLAGDSDYLWGRFLVELGVVDGDEYEARNQAFYDQYRAGRLDIQAFLAFSLAPLAQYPRARLEAWRARFLAQCIAPLILPAGRERVAAHRARGDVCVIVTATNRFVTAPIAERIGVDALLATELEEVGGRFTGRPAGTPCFREGKVQRLEAWLAQAGLGWADSTFYSDSHNDLPLLERVAHPVAVDPDQALRRIAGERGWPVISLRSAEG